MRDDFEMPPPAEDMTPLQGALYMIRRGFRVFPLKPESKDPFTDDDKKAGAIEEFCGGIHRATRNTNTVRRWFRLEPRLNYGVSMNGRVGLDADVADGKPGIDTLLELGPLPNTLQIASARGGVHTIFGEHECGQADLGPGLNVRSKGGYLVGPGCVFKGKKYRIIVDAPVAPCPEFLKERLAKAQERAADNTTPLAEETEAAVKWGVEFLTKEPGAVQGERNQQLFRLACILKDKGLTELTIVELLTEHWCPRCDPPYDVEGEITNTVRSAFQNGKRQPGVDAPQAEFEAHPDLTTAAQQEGPAADTKPTGPEFVPVDLSIDPATQKTRDWITTDDFQRGTLAGLVAPGGGLKSAFIVNFSMGAVMGDLSKLGMKIHDGKPKKVLLISAEDDYEEVRRRSFAVCKHHRFDPAQALDENGENRFRMYAPADASRFCAMMRDGKKGLRVTDKLKRLEAYIVEHGIDIVIYDPFVEIHEASENDNSELAKVLGALRGIAMRTRSLGLIVHHTGKVKAGEWEGNADAGRGASAFRGALRCVLTLSRPSEEDRKVFDLSDEQMRNCYRLDNAKGNHSPQRDGPRWYSRISVTLDNGETAPAVNFEDKINGSGQKWRDVVLDWARKLFLQARKLRLSNGDPVRLSTSNQSAEWHAPRWMRKNLPEGAPDITVDHFKEAIETLLTCGDIAVATNSEGKKYYEWIGPEPIEPASGTIGS